MSCTNKQHVVRIDAIDDKKRNENFSLSFVVHRHQRHTEREKEDELGCVVVRQNWKSYKMVWRRRVESSQRRATEKNKLLFSSFESISASSILVSSLAYVAHVYAVCVCFGQFGRRRWLVEYMCVCPSHVVWMSKWTVRQCVWCSRNTKHSIVPLCALFNICYFVNHQFSFRSFHSVRFDIDIGCSGVSYFPFCFKFFRPLNESHILQSPNIFLNWRIDSLWREERV